MEQQGTSNPWFSIWVRPKQTIQEITDKNPRMRFFVLSFIYGFPWMLQFAQSLSIGMSWSLPFLLILAIVLAIPVGAIAFSLTAVILHWTGKLIKGQSSFINLRAAVSWSNVPNVVTIALWLVLLGFFGIHLFDSYFTSHDFTSTERMVVMITSGIELVAMIWSLVILVHAVAAVQKFSSWMGLLNVILSIIVLILLSYIIKIILAWIGLGG
ncbi:MAG: Yip1 family protein [Candidatus Algichlamydia australiensis]|nr:Yip1 family protein [Chlamydiales bacterium]